MTSPDRMTYKATCEAAAAAKVAPDRAPQDTRTHQDEILIAHTGTPGVGVPAPEPDHGADDRAKLR
jgi:hypothetical protein